MENQGLLKNTLLPSSQNNISVPDFGGGVNLPKDFLLGAASSAHQVEGNNTNSDWWYFEQHGKLPKSGLAADHYNRYEEDFKLAKQIGLNLMRISIEWARIEPEEGKFNMAEVEHYRNVLKTLRFLGFKRMVTLWHWTLPFWLYNQGGFLDSKTGEKFARYAKFVTEQLGEEIDYFITINEPEMYCYLAYRKGVAPPFKKNFFQMRKVLNNLLKAHSWAYFAIKSVSPKIPISIAKNSLWYEPRRKNILDGLVAHLSNYFSNHYSLNKIKNQLDYIGLNYYFFKTVKFTFTTHWEMKEVGNNRSDMNWRIEPQGIYSLLLDLKRYNKPIFITENGIANAKDDHRKGFIRDHLFWIAKAISTGADVRGYCYWSLTDTYEWHDGFNPKFGLIEVNFETQQRKVRPSASVFKELTHE